MRFYRKNEFDSNTERKKKQQNPIIFEVFVYTLIEFRTRNASLS